MSKRTDRKKVILITGASSGIGKVCAEHLAQEGHLVFGTSRRAPFPPEEPRPGRPRMLQMDVNEEESVQRGVDFILEEAGQLDAVVNNAGFGIAGAVEDTSIDEAKELFETNFFGVMRVCRAVLPAMRERRSGLIVNISSLAGLIGLPYQGLYSATKFAIEGLTEALRIEVQPFDVQVVLIEPGDIRTSFTDNRRMVAGAEASVYADDCKHMMGIVEIDERNGAPAEGVAYLLARIIAHPAPRLRYRVGPLTQKIAGALKGVIPGRLLEWALTQYYLR